MHGSLKNLVLLFVAFSGLLHAQLSAQQTEPARQGVDYLTVEAVPLTPEQREQAQQRADEEKRLIAERGIFGAFLTRLDDPRRALACDKVAEIVANAAATASEPELRVSRLPDAWRLHRRAAFGKTHALATMSASELRKFDRQFAQNIELASLIPDPELAKSADFSESDFLYAFALKLAARCHQSLDEAGFPDISSEPPRDYIDQNSQFKFRGANAATVFEGTDLVPYAQSICAGRSDFDFSDAPMDQRGYAMMSLLDWAIECEDKPAFSALIDAGFDLEAKGLWQNPPIVNSATEERLWYLRAMLDAGANPDAKGVSQTALSKAHNDIDASNRGGDADAAFNLLRERGASLNFPNFEQSMWWEWGLHGRNNGWGSILAHWDEFDSDPVALADLAEQVLTGQLEWLKDEKAHAKRVKTLLIEKYGVCFPVGNSRKFAREERGFRIQPNCSK